MAAIAGSREISTANILGAAWLFFRGNAARAGVAVVIMGVSGGLVDAGIIGQEFNLVSVFLFVFLQFWITQTLLDDLGLRFASRPRFTAFFVQGLIVGAALMFGFIFLVVPGIILMVRWSICGPVLISSDLSITESIAESWRETQGHFWPILFVLLIVYGSTLVAAAAGFVAADLRLLGLPSLAGTAVAELAISAGNVAAWHVYVALYAMIVRPDRVADVFA